MKKFLSSIMVLSIVYLGTNVISEAAIINNSDKGKIAVQTSANTEIAPDVVEISFAIKTYDAKSMQKATLANKEISDKVLSELKSLIDTDNGDYIKTSDFSANPVYSYVNSKQNFEKYEVSNRVIVHISKTDIVGKMIDKAILTGATNVDSLSFSVSNYEKQCNDLLVIATKKAQDRANVIAESLGTSLDGISSLTTSCSANNYNQPRYYMAKNMIADVAAESASLGAGTTISNGVIKINATVNANFFVK